MSSAVSSVTLVAQATRDNDTPPSGYQLDLLCRATYSSISECETIQGALVSRISSKSANVKWKCLRVIGYLCSNGNPAIRKGFQRSTDILRSSANFTGPLHPLQGDAPNERVRAMAKEALNALFSSTANNDTDFSSKRRPIFNDHLSGGAYTPSSNDIVHIPNAITNAIKTVFSARESMSGINSINTNEEYAHQRGTYTPTIIKSGNGMVGFGNPAFQRSPSFPSSSGNTILDRVKQVFEPVAHSRSASGPSIRSPIGGLGGPVNRANFEVAPARLDDSTVPRQRGKVGGVWGQSTNDDRTDESPHVDESSMMYHVPRQGLSNVAQSANAVVSGQYEARLVDDLTAASGLTSVPNREKLNSFISAFSSLNQFVILSYLNEKLKADHWQSQMKALSVIEALWSNFSSVVSDFFESHNESLSLLTSSPIRQVKSKSQSVYALLYGRSVPDNAPERSSSPQTDVSSQPIDLLDMRSLSISQSHAPGFPDERSSSSESRPVATDLFANIIVRENPSEKADPLSFMGNNPSNSTSEVWPLASSQVQQQSVFLSMFDQSAPIEQISQNSGFSLPSADPAASLTFPSNPSAESKSVEPKAMDPFASAVKLVRAAPVSSLDSFAFVQDMMKSPGNPE